jgi:arginyl-tRNA--protein-N-Asp/Glu arginylyltransferase
MEECNICIENKDIKNIFNCINCKFKNCIECHKKYLLNSVNEPHCMNCRSIIPYDIFLEKFNECASTKECIAPVGSSRANHRQDQAVFTILYYKFMMTHPSYTNIKSYFGINIHRDCD